MGPSEVVENWDVLRELRRCPHRAGKTTDLCGYLNSERQDESGPSCCLLGKMLVRTAGGSLGGTLLISLLPHCWVSMG